MSNSLTEKANINEETDTVDEKTNTDGQKTTDEQIVIDKQNDTVDEQIVMDEKTTTKRINTSECLISNREACKLGKKWKRIDEDMRNTILHEHNVNRLTQKQIADIVGTSQATVYNILNRHSPSTRKTCKPRKKRKHVDEDMNKTILHEHNVNSLTQKQIADIVGTSQATVYNILNRYSPSTRRNCKPRKEGKRVNESMRKVILHEHTVNGLILKEIADIVGTSQMTVSRILSRDSPGTRKICKPRKERKRVDENIRKTILYERNVNGLTLKEIVAIVGTSQKTVCNILKTFREKGLLKPLRSRLQVKS